MNNSRKMILFLCVVLSITAFVMVEVYIVKKKFIPKKADTYNRMSLLPEVQNENGWPMFRGNQGLSGVANGELPDSLDFLWRFKTGADVKSTPIIDSNIVYVGSSDSNIYAIDLYSGQQFWAYKTDDSVEAAPLYINGIVCAGSSGGILYAIDAVTGTFQWKYETGGQILGAANWTYSPDNKNIWVIVGSYDNCLHCVNSRNGKLIWKYESGNYINGSPSIEGEVAVFGGCDEVIHVVSLTDGAEEKKIEGGSYIAASAAIADGQVYVGNYDNVFIRADIDSGQIIWKYTESDSPFFSSPAIDQNYVVVGSRDEHVHCINRNDGKKIWTFPTLGEVDSSPVICGDKVITGSQDGNIYMIRLSDGSKVWSYEIGQGITSSPAVARGMVVIGCDDGYVYAFGKKE